VITASAVERVMACPASEALDHVQTESHYSERGRAIHDFLEQLTLARGRGLSLELARKEALELISLEWRPVCEAIDVRRLPPLERFAPEYAMAWRPMPPDASEPEEYKALGALGSHRGYRAAGIDDSWLAGTADLIAIGVRENGQRVAVVGDWKSGWSKRTEARRNPQLLFLAKMAMFLFDCPTAEVFLIVVEEGVPPRVDHATVGAWDMAVFTEELYRALEEVKLAHQVRRANGQLRQAAGPHCTHCPAFVHCPAKRALIASIPAGTALDFRHAGEDDQLAIAQRFEWFQEAEAAMARVKAAFREWAMTRPITLSDGKVYGPVLVGKEEIDGAAALELVRRFVRAELDSFVTRSPDVPAPAMPDKEIEGAFAFETSKTALAKVARTVAQMVGRPISRVETELLDYLRGAGAVANTPKTEVHVRKPKAPAAAAK
jgi:RecB family exonuclease